jgi:hypothetical protein
VAAAVGCQLVGHPVCLHQAIIRQLGLLPQLLETGHLHMVKSWWVLLLLQLVVYMH